MVLEVTKSIFILFFNFLKIPLIIILLTIVLFLFLIFFNIIICLAKGKRFKKGSKIFLKKDGFFKKIFINFPKQFTNDLFDREPDFFKYQGLIIFEGRQGSGKTISMVQAIQDMQEEFPLSKTMTNFDLLSQDLPLNNWKELIDFKNDIFGVIVGMDELQNWFSSNDSKNFPPEMLSVITQNRKNRRVILGTSQNFYLLAKAIRSQATEVRKCYTIFGCITFVRKVIPILDSEGNVKEWKNNGMYFFVHNKKLRNSYDTYKVIENLRKSGFVEQPINNFNSSNNYFINYNKK